VRDGDQSLCRGPATLTGYDPGDHPQIKQMSARGEAATEKRSPVTAAMRAGISGRCVTAGIVLAMTETMPWAETLHRLGSELISGLLVVVVRDPTVPGAVAQPLLGEIYVELGHGYLQLVSVNSHGGLRSRHLDAIDLQSYHEEFDPENVFTVRLDSLFLGESSDVECLQVNYMTNEESDLSHGIVRCAEFVLSHGHRIFFDPMYTGGIRVGNTDPWTTEWDNGPWTFQRHTWTRP
jgi:hypothetical protein